MSTKRQELKENQQKWMNERDLNEILLQNHNENEEKETHEFNSEILNEVTHKIATKLQQKILKSQTKIIIDDHEQYSLGTVNDLIENELNFNCAICLEMMISPLKEPLLLIPCSHSFCKQCIFRIIYNTQPSKQRNATLINNQCVELSVNSFKKCPFCRKRIKSFVGNIQLRQLIEKMFKLKDQEQQKIKNDMHNKELLQSNKEILRFRKNIIMKELKSIKKKKVKIDGMMNSYQLIIDHLRNEEIETKKRYNLIKRELELIEKQLNVKSDEMLKLKMQRNKVSGKYHLLQNSLTKLQSQLDKFDVLSFDT